MSFDLERRRDEWGNCQALGGVLREMECGGHVHPRLCNECERVALPAAANQSWHEGRGSLEETEVSASLCGGEEELERCVSAHQHWRAASIPPWHGDSPLLALSLQGWQRALGVERKEIYIRIKHDNVVFIFLYTKCQTIKFANFSPCNCTVES